MTLVDPSHPRSVSVLTSCDLPPLGVRHATAMSAGGFVFVTGATTLDFAPDPGIASSIWPRSPQLAEATGVIDGVVTSIGAAGCGVDRLVRIDQFYPRGSGIDDYQVARRNALSGHIPPSTSIIVDGLLSPDATCDVSVVAALPGSPTPERLFPGDLPVPTWAGFAPVMRHGDWVFVAGQMADGDVEGLDPKLANWRYHNWGTRPIVRQSELIITERLPRALEAAESSFDSLLKAQAYVAATTDIPYFLEVWERLVGLDRCALTVVPGAAFNATHGVIEINLVACTDRTRDQRETLDLPRRDFGFGATAVRFGDLLFPSGLIARPDPERNARAQRYKSVGGSADELTEVLIRLAQICEGAGSSLDQVVRIQQFHDKQPDFYSQYAAWHEAGGGEALPFSIVNTGSSPGPEGTTLILDAWVYAPRFSTQPSSV